MKDNSFVVLTDELISEIFDTILVYVQSVFTAESAYQFLYMEDDVVNYDYKKFFPNSYSDNQLSRCPTMGGTVNLKTWVQTMVIKMNLELFPPKILL